MCSPFQVWVRIDVVKLPHTCSFERKRIDAALWNLTETPASQVIQILAFQFKNRRAKWRKRERHVGADFKAANFASSFAPAMIMQPAGMQTFDDPAASFYSTTTPGYSSWPPAPTAAGRFAADSARAFAAAGAAAWSWKPAPVGPPMLSPAGQATAVQSTPLARYGSAVHQGTGGGAATAGFSGLFGPAAAAVGCPCAVPQSPYGTGASSSLSIGGGGGNGDIPPLTRIKPSGSVACPAPATPTSSLPNFAECQYIPISGVSGTLSTR